MGGEERRARARPLARGAASRPRKPLRGWASADVASGGAPARRRRMVVGGGGRSETARWTKPRSRPRKTEGRYRDNKSKKRKGYWQMKMNERRAADNVGARTSRIRNMVSVVGCRLSVVGVGVSIARQGLHPAPLAPPRPAPPRQPAILSSALPSPSHNLPTRISFPFLLSYN